MILSLGFIAFVTLLHIVGKVNIIFKKCTVLRESSCKSHFACSAVTRKLTRTQKLNILQHIVNILFDIRQSSLTVRRMVCSSCIICLVLCRTVGLNFFTAAK